MRTLLLTLTTCLLVLPVQAKYSGGTGEPNDPYQIATAAHLIALGETPADYDKHFILTANIDLDPNLPGRKVFDKAVIAPDVNDATWRFDGTRFTGVFDGNGHTISHLTMVGKDYLGLFGELSGQVRNLGAVDVNVTGSGSFVGGLVGYNSWGSITTCHSTGAVSGIGQWSSLVGGLVGSNGHTVTQCYSNSTVSGESFVGGLAGQNDGTVTQCYSTGMVAGEFDVGGLVGRNDGEATNCYSTSTVSGVRFVGGLVGDNGGVTGWFMEPCAGTVTNCYSTGTVSGDSSVGGLVGYNGGAPGGDFISSAPGGTVTDCYSSGLVNGTDRVGGLVGSNTDDSGNEGSVTRSFWDIQTSGQATSAGGLGKTTAEMQRAKTFLEAGWDFVDETANGTDDIWKIAEGLDYPRLWWEPYDGRVTVVLGQVFAVTLESNPSTGYRWEWVDSQDSILEQIGEAQFKPRETGDPPLVGAGGWESFNFKAVNQGQMTLKLVYRRPWEEGVEPLKTFSLQVTVP